MESVKVIEITEHYKCRYCSHSHDIISKALKIGSIEIPLPFTRFVHVK